MFDVGVISFVTFFGQAKKSKHMSLDKIRSLKSKDLFYLVAYSMIGLTIPFLLLILLMQAFGVPFTFNDVSDPIMA